jgi:hypothetical protein
MKKIYFTLAMLLSFGFAIAQSNLVPTQGPEASELSKTDMAKISASLHNHLKSRTANSKTTKSRWYCYGFAMAELLGGQTSVLNANNLWPDTTILVQYSNSVAGPWIHSLAESCDPKSDVFDKAGELDINQYMPYNVDSIGFYCLYYRVANQASVVDSINFQFQIGLANGQYELDATTYTWVSTYNVDTLFVKKIKHDLLANYSTLSTYVNYKFALTASMADDTLSNGINYWKFPINLAVPAGKSVACAIQYIPKSTWTANVDTISSVNHMRFLSYEENGDNTDLSYTKGDYNCSYILTSKWMYDTLSTNYSASYFYYPSYSYEHHLVEFLLTSDETSIANTTKTNVLSVNQNRPNPFSGMTTISYNLSSSQNVDVVVYSVAGAKVMSINQGVQSAGSHSVQIDASELQAGIYYYTVTADGYSVTKKMIVY